MTTNVPLISNQHITFRKANISDVSFMIKTEQHPDIRPYLIVWSNEQHQIAMHDANYLHIIIEDSYHRAVGYIILRGLLNTHDSIEFMRIAIAEQGKGWGKEAVKLLITYTFEQLKAHRLWVDVKEQNLRAQYIYRNCGFQQEGVLRDCLKIAEGTYESLMIMSILNTRKITPQVG
ncbi:GNAT family N-acetyltransferase [Paenibacillus pini]|uniref:Acetyltransferase n=1 Tax=Paenibacillus pini JCM 16418 TaxID=1236976 RepID=W7YCF6_9BACL|nr:GNAT family protein [Paenibacillus pini]GAF06122.1 acetyltransferase [Paenibacillus pini JCM 16418]